jgi:hypothetical protein
MSLYVIIEKERKNITDFTLTLIQFCSTEKIEKAIEGTVFVISLKGRCVARWCPYLKGVRSSWLMDARKLLLI